MTAISLHPAPSRQTVAREQLRSVGLALRTEGILYVSALVFLFVLAILGVLHDMRSGHSHGNNGLWYGPAATFPITLIGLFLPFSVWRNEDPSRRSYHWAMPVDRASHTLVKVATGWVWLMAATAVYLLFIVGLSAAITLITHSTWRGSHVAAWEWLVPFTSATVAYLLGSAAAIASDHPWRWIVGLFIGYWACMALAASLDLHGLLVKLGNIVDGYYGMKAAMFGLVRHDAARWLGATALWGAIGVVGVAAALRRRGEG